MQQEQRRLAAILAADVAGYSRLMAADESGTLARLKRLCTEVIEPKIAQFNGRIVGSAGDSLLVEFASALNAVQCAVAAQEGLADRNATLPEDRRMAFRMGVNLGDVIPEGDTIHGDGVNIASQLEKLAEPGSICIGRNVYDQVKSKLAYTYADLGEQRVHNIPEPVHAFRVMSSSLAASASLRISAKDALAQPDKPSIAVLPFQNMSGDPEQEYFSDGITEDIITELSRFHSLFVIARNSSFIYKGRAVNVIDVGRALGVRYVAEGSIRRASNRVRVTAQLIDALTGSHLWAERFDRELEDIFAVQDEVTRRIVTSIAPLVAAESLQLAKRKPPEDMQAYDYYLKAKSLVDLAQSAADLSEGRALCDRAIELDPSYARAYAYKAFSYIVGTMILESGELNERQRLALQCAEQAVALDPMDSVCQWALGETAFHLRQYDRSRSHIARAISLNPNDADVLVVSSFIQAACSDFELGLLHLEMALERNPSHPRWYDWVRGLTLNLVGRYNEALAAFDLYGRPNVDVLKWRAVTLVQLGQIDEARTAALLAIRPDLTIREARKIFDYLPNNESHLGALRQAGLPE